MRLSLKQFLVFSFLFLVLLYAQPVTDTINKPVKKIDKYYKSPFLATLLSTAIPGGGQFYTQNYWKAILIAGTEGTLAYFAIQDHLDYEDTHNTTYRNRRNNLLWWLATVKVLSMADAYVSANMFKFKEQMQLSINYDLTDNKVQIGLLTKALNR